APSGKPTYSGAIIITAARVSVGGDGDPPVSASSPVPIDIASSTGSTTSMPAPEGHATATTSAPAAAATGPASTRAPAADAMPATSPDASTAATAASAAVAHQGNHQIVTISSAPRMAALTTRVMSDGTIAASALPCGSAGVDSAISPIALLIVDDG